MTLDLSAILPNTSHSLDGSGFIFGAGASFEAGYPLVSTLTRDVVRELSPHHRSILDEVLGSAGVAYDDAKALPNIEQIADHVMAHWTNSGDPKFSELEGTLRELILNRILSVKDPNLEHHCIFLEALKKRAFGLPCCVWIFTTNYDLLFEIAAAKTGVFLENAFCGSTYRFFNPAQLRTCFGTIEKMRFTEAPQLTIKLIKLHGSISWFEDGGKFYEQHPQTIPEKARRAIVLPRRRKIMDTLTPPYDALFTQANKIVGGQCRYLVSCGFSYGDDHINDNILLPAMLSKRVRLFALSLEEPAGTTLFKTMPNYQGAFSTHSIINGRKEAETTSLWQFSKFVKLF